jgi:DNA-binding FrmR family transcriptional regulator
MKKETAKLNKAAGQISGLAKMVEAEVSCEKIIIQFKAVKGALDSVFFDVLQNSFERCSRKKNSAEIKLILKQIAKK